MLGKQHVVSGGALVSICAPAMFAFCDLVMRQRGTLQKYPHPFPLSPSTLCGSISWPLHRDSPNVLNILCNAHHSFHAVCGASVSLLRLIRLPNMEAHALLANLPAEPGNLVGIFNYRGEGMVLIHGAEVGLSASYSFVNVANIYVSRHDHYFAGR